MSAVPTPHGLQPDQVVARLRAAGCVFAEDEARLLAEAAATPADLAALTDRRATGVPLEQVLGWAQFRGLRVVVEPGVFVPRRRTELLAGLAAEAAAAAGARPVVVDLCCGSGAVGAVVLADLPGVRLHAADLDPAAVRCARRNLGPVGATVHQGDLYDALPHRLRGRVDVVAANAPYVPTEAIALMPREARAHENVVALDGGPDGADVLRRVVAGAPAWLRGGGQLLVESSERQAPLVVEALTRAGLAAQVVRSDEVGGTVVRGTRPTTAATSGGEPR